jgi:hypothetical protein
MNKAIVAKHDFLGVVAIGSIIGNLAQAGERTEIKRQHRALLGLYRHFVGRYKMLLQEYQAFRQVNTDLQNQVLRLREENNRLQDSLAAEESAK